MDYKESGVDRQAGDDFVDRLESKMSRDRRPEVLSGLGDFGASFVAPSHYKNPVFVASTDGVGTKLMLAEVWGRESHRAMGQDVVAMCVNDLLCCRAEPLVFLDYVATGSLQKNNLDLLLDGIIGACRESHCSLIGGETAEMPGFYAPGRYDVAGFAIGVSERDLRFKRENVQAGDLIYGLPSSGFHSNGFSLVRKVIEKQSWKLDQILDGSTLGEQLLLPTRLYVKSFLKMIERVRVKAAAHITGGGLIENLPRGFEEKKYVAHLQKSKIPTAPLMQRFVEAAGLEEREAYSTWNMGIGFCAIVERGEAALMQTEFTDWIALGEILPRELSTLKEDSASVEIL